MNSILNRSKMACIAILIAIVVFAQVFSLLTSEKVEAADVSSMYSFKPVKIGGGGFVTGIVMHPENSDLVYVRTDVGGAYKWDVNTQSWSQLINSNTMPSEVMNEAGGNPGIARQRAYQVDSIGLDPNNQDVVFIAAGGGNSKPGYMLKSTDGGKSFVLTNLKSLVP